MPSTIRLKYVQIFTHRKRCCLVHSVSLLAEKLCAASVWNRAARGNALPKLRYFVDSEPSARARRPYSAREGLCPGSGPTEWALSIDNTAVARTADQIAERWEQLEKTIPMETGVAAQFGRDLARRSSNFGEYKTHPLRLSALYTFLRDLRTFL